MMAVSYVDQLKEVRRELAKRESVFPRFVTERKMTQSAADRHMAVMRAVAETLKPLADAEEAAARERSPELGI